MERTVKVWSEPQKIRVYQTSQSIWIAIGTYMGKPIQAKGRSESSAAAHWQIAAQYQRYRVKDRSIGYGRGSAEIH